MTGTFAYSFDRETYHGRYPTREAALAAAGQALRDRVDLPPGIFVAQWSVPDPQTEGHAEAVIAAMQDRFRQATGDSGYLATATEQQAADLDSVLRQTVADWLERHRLTPKPTRVHAVGHYPIPNVHHVAVPVVERETSMIGEA